MLTLSWLCTLSLGCGESKNSESLQPSAEIAGPSDPVESSSRKGDSLQSAKEPVVTIADGRQDREAKIAKSDELVAKQDFVASAALLRELLLLDPSDVEVLFRLANVAASMGDLSQAIDLLGDIPVDHPEAGLPALGQSADWCFRLERYSEAEEKYLKILEKVPAAVPAIRNLAYLRNRQGRRHEAAAYIHKLCELGDVRQDELHALIVLSDAMYDDPPSSDSESHDRPLSKPVTTGDRPYWPIGDSGVARKFFDDNRFADVIDLLDETVAKGNSAPAVVAMYGRAVAEAQDDERFLRWYAGTNAETRQFSEYWAAVGSYLLDQQKFKPSVRALAEAITRDPTDIRSIGRLRNALLALGEKEAADDFAERWELMREAVRINNQVAANASPDPKTIAELATVLESLNRSLESVLWTALEQHFGQAPKSQRIELNQRRQRLVASKQMFPTTLQRLCGLNHERFPMPQIESLKIADRLTKSGQARTKPAPAVLLNVADQIGLKHEYRVAKDSISFGFGVHQMLGGGVVVIDYDLDGACDFYFAQGGSDPPEFRGEKSNQLYRSVDAALVETTSKATSPNGTADSPYTIGVTAGDWNQDGFPDLVVSNIGLHELLINNGDGTFRRKLIAETANKNRVPSSVAVVDLNGDNLPDIYQANYVDDPRMVLKPPTNSEGQPLQPVLPSKYVPGADRWFQNDGRGGIEIQRLTSDAGDDSTSLGVVIANFDDQPGVEIFVANDMDPNHFWRRTTSGEWIDNAIASGCAFSNTGAATASMGVAAGDFENNGTLDLHITNFEGENASLYLNREGAFQERTIQYHLAPDSHPSLGFGTQAIDYDNDGLRDLVVVNGHIDDAVSNNSPFHQLPQLFSNLGARFMLADVSDPSGYWNSAHLGRSLAKLDFDRDGKVDLVTTNIEQPSALLLNQSPSTNHWLQVQLVGTQSERDSIGARISVRSGGDEWTEWVIAGDGYLCHNENVAAFGLGEKAMIDQIIIDWPSGNRQMVLANQVDRRLLIVEGDDQAFTLFEGK